MLGLGFTSFFFNPSLSLSGVNIWWGRTGRVDWQLSQMWSVNKPNQNWDSFQTRRKHRQRRCNQSTFGSIYWEATQTNEHKVGERRRFPSSSRSFLHVSSSLLHFKSIYIPTTLYYTRTPTSSPLFVCFCVCFFLTLSYHRSRFNFCPGDRFHPGRIHLSYQFGPHCSWNGKKRSER